MGLYCISPFQDFYNWGVYDKEINELYVYSTHVFIEYKWNITKEYLCWLDIKLQIDMVVLTLSMWSISIYIYGNKSHCVYVKTQNNQ